MKKNKIILASVATLMAVSPVLPFNLQAHTVQAATNSIRNTIIHTAIRVLLVELHLMITKQFIILKVLITGSIQLMLMQQD